MNNDMEYVGFWPRTGAAMIDSIWQIVATLPLLALFYGWTYFSDSHEGLQGVADFVISYILPAVIIVGFWKLKQATPGKMAISSRIVDAETGDDPSTIQCIGRYFGYFISTLPVGLGFFWVGFDKKKQGWHDKIAGTVVVRYKKKEPAPVSFESAYQTNVPK